MKRISFIPIVFLILFASSSCKKYGHGSIQGTVLETGTNLPVANALVMLNQSTSDLFSEQIDSTRTDSKGNFIIYYKKEKKGSYYFDALEKDHTTTTIKLINPSDNKNENVTLFMDHMAYIKLRIKKTSSSTNSISVNTVFTYLILSIKNPFDTLITEPFRVQANRDQRINWSVRDWTVEHSLVTYGLPKSFQLKPNDTLSYTIEFE